jgi:hypothetical protein
MLVFGEPASRIPERYTVLRGCSARVAERVDLSSWRCNREQAEPKLSRALKLTNTKTARLAKKGNVWRAGSDAVETAVFLATFLFGIGEYFLQSDGRPA